MQKVQSSIFKIVAFLLLTAFSFWRCNLNDSKGNILLDLKLDDSLSFTKGYDSIVVNILDTAGNVLQPKIFHGKYLPERDTPTLANLQLNNPPTVFIIKIYGYNSSIGTILIETRVENGFQKTLPTKILKPISNGAVPSPIPIDTTKLFPKDSIGVQTNPIYFSKPISILILGSSPMSLWVGSNPTPLNAHIVPDSANQGIVWKILDTSIAQITFDKKIRPVKTGKSTLIATSKEDSTVSDSISFEVVIPIKVDGISLSPANLSIYVGEIGGLFTKTIGSDSGAKILFTSSDTNLASVTQEGKVKGLNEGKVKITASVIGYPSLNNSSNINVLRLPSAPVLSIISPSNSISINQNFISIKFSIKDSSQNIDIIKDSLVSGLVMGPNTITVSRSNIGGTSRILVVVTVNTIAPNVPVFDFQNQFTNSQTLIWSWSSVIGAAKYQVRINDSDFNNSGNTDVTTPITSFRKVATTEGNYTLYLRSIDSIGNVSNTSSQLLTVDQTLPGEVIFIGNPFSSFQTPTWNWKTSEVAGASDSFEVSLDGGTPFVLRTNYYSPPTLLSDNSPHKLSVSQFDQVLGQKRASNSFTYQVIVNPPAAPKVSGPTGVLQYDRTNKLSFTWTDETRGNSIFRIRINAESSYREINNTSKTFSLDAKNSPDGTYTIYVEESDALGRWGVPGSFTLNLDRTGPTITFPYSAFVTNLSPATFRYLVDGIELKSTSCILSSSNGAATNCSVSGADELGNVSILSLPVYYRANTIFITPNGTGNGSSWDESSSKLNLLLADSSLSGKEFWLGQGTYDSELKPLLKSNGTLTILGGFDPKAYPITSVFTRYKLGTIFTSQFRPTGIGAILKVDGIFFKHSIRLDQTRLDLSDSRIESNTAPYALYCENSAVFNSVNNEFRNGNYSQSTINIFGSEANFIGGSISYNQSVQWPIYLASPNLNVKFLGGISILGNASNLSDGAQINLRQGQLNFSDDTEFNCSEVTTAPFAQYTCKGKIYP